MIFCANTSQKEKEKCQKIEFQVKIPTLYIIYVESIKVRFSKTGLIYLTVAEKQGKFFSCRFFLCRKLGFGS